MTDPDKGAHDGYAGEAGTYRMQDGLRIAVDPQTLKPFPSPEPEPVPGKTKPAAEPAKKAADANTTTDKNE